MMQLSQKSPFYKFEGENEADSCQKVTCHVELEKPSHALTNFLDTPQRIVKINAQKYTRAKQN